MHQPMRPHFLRWLDLEFSCVLFCRPYTWEPREFASHDEIQTAYAPEIADKDMRNRLTAASRQIQLRTLCKHVSEAMPGDAEASRDAQVPIYVRQHVENVQHDMNSGELLEAAWLDQPQQGFFDCQDGTKNFETFQQKVDSCPRSHVPHIIYLVNQKKKSSHLDDILETFDDCVLMHLTFPPILYFTVICSCSFFRNLELPGSPHDYVQRLAMPHLTVGRLHANTPAKWELKSIASSTHQQICLAEAKRIYPKDRLLPYTAITFCASERSGPPLLSEGALHDHKHGAGRQPGLVVPPAKPVCNTARGKRSRNEPKDSQSEDKAAGSVQGSQVCSLLCGLGKPEFNAKRCLLPAWRHGQPA